MCLVAQSCPTLCNPMGYSLPGSSVHGDSPGRNTGVGCYVLLQGSFPTQESNPGLLHCKQILYHLSHRGSQGVNGMLYKEPGTAIQQMAFMKSVLKLTRTGRGI